eukprot:m.374457 g.374457  ORF g.374457 m.374457 type:complete len:105 (+) comp20907_c0_seq7:168-482(+)
MSSGKCFGDEEASNFQKANAHRKFSVFEQQDTALSLCVTEWEIWGCHVIESDIDSVMFTAARGIVSGNGECHAQWSQSRLHRQSAWCPSSPVSGQCKRHILQVR